MRVSLLRLALLVFAFAFTACSSFDQEWRRAAITPAADKFSGRWEGHWTSAKHAGSGGRLQCLLSPLASSSERDQRTYRAFFKAHWLIFSSSYVVPLRATERDGQLRFEGSHALPALVGGVYRFKGSATTQRFLSSYDSSYDQGRFEMKHLP